MQGYIDLHVHSNCSDGTFAPEELVAHALKKQLRAFALTDHDSIEGISRAEAAAEGTSLTVIPGIELSTEYQGKDIHILGLGIDPENKAFLDYLRRFQEARDLRNEKMIRRLQEYGVDITPEKMLEQFPDCIWTRSHFALYLQTHGYVKEMWDAFPKYIGNNAPCYVPREGITPRQAVQLVLEGKGHPVLAHPILYRLNPSRLEALVADLTSAGLQGIEAIYSQNRYTDESAMKQLAKRHGLAVTGGSDFHGANKKDIGLGSGKGNLKIPYELWENLASR